MDDTLLFSTLRDPARIDGVRDLPTPVTDVTARGDQKKRNQNLFPTERRPSMEKLKDDLTRAAAAAAEAAGKVDDGGTCNLDAVIVPTGKNYPLKRMTKKLDEVFAPFGGSRIDWGWQGKGYLLTYSYGQANKRSTASAAAAKALSDWDAFVHYHTD
jgi:hypothetical protein